MAQNNYNWPINPTTVNSGPIQIEINGIPVTIDPTLGIYMPVKEYGDAYLTSGRIDYSVSNVTNGAWTQVIANTGPTQAQGITLFDGGGFAMELGIGAAAAEARILLIPPGGFNGKITLQIPAGSRLSVRAVGAALVNAGEIDINLLG